MNDYFKEWRGITSKDIYLNLFRDKELFEIATLGKVPDEVFEFMKEEVLEHAENGIIDEDDLAPLLHINLLLEGVTEKEKFKHIVVDEAQDYNPFQIYLINKLSKGNSLTLVGDLAQGIYYYKGVKTWEDITNGVFNGKATYIQLTQSYRSTVEIIEFANGALEAQKLGLKSAKPVLRHGKEPSIIKCNENCEIVYNINRIISEIKDEGKSSIAIITKSLEEGKALEKMLKKKIKEKISLVKGTEKKSPGDISIIPAYLTKGLEFDATIIYDPSKGKYSNRLLIIKIIVCFFN